MRMLVRCELFVWVMGGVDYLCGCWRGVDYLYG